MAFRVASTRRHEGKDRAHGKIVGLVEKGKDFADVGRHPPDVLRDSLHGETFGIALLGFQERLDPCFDRPFGFVSHLRRGKTQREIVRPRDFKQSDKHKGEEKEKEEEERKTDRFKDFIRGVTRITRSVDGFPKVKVNPLDFVGERRPQEGPRDVGSSEDPSLHTSHNQKRDRATMEQKRATKTRKKREIEERKER